MTDLKKNRMDKLSIENEQTLLDIADGERLIRVNQSMDANNWAKILAISNRNDENISIHQLPHHSAAVKRIIAKNVGFCDELSKVIQGSVIDYEALPEGWSMRSMAVHEFSNNIGLGYTDGHAYTRIDPPGGYSFENSRILDNWPDEPFYGSPGKYGISKNPENDLIVKSLTREGDEYKIHDQSGVLTENGKWSDLVDSYRIQMQLGRQEYQEISRRAFEFSQNQDQRPTFQEVIQAHDSGNKKYQTHNVRRAEKNSSYGASGVF